tara:strand:+ start:589 stop:1566 length:978 start_codon:yes stop_codon:yes gene_type:complete
MNQQKILVVYNICGLGRRPSVDHYFKCIDSFLDQDLDNYRIIVSSCMSHPDDFRSIHKRYKDKVSYVYHHEPHIVNITFNKSVQEYVNVNGPAESYMFVDSGCSFEDPETGKHQNNILTNTYNTFKETEKSMLSIQVDTDEGLQLLDPQYKWESSGVQIVNEHFHIPLGKAINCHITLFSNEHYEAYNKKIVPDVFAAYCTESTFRYLAAAIKTKWYIMKDQQVRHLKEVEGASLSQPHVSQTYHNTWNNLMYNRNALDFINDEEVKKSGIGYEECNDILPHNSNAYDQNDMPIDPSNMKKLINKYFFLSDNELNYDSIKVTTRI